MERCGHVCNPRRGGLGRCWRHDFGHVDHRARLSPSCYGEVEMTSKPTPLWHNDKPRVLAPWEIEAMTRQCIIAQYPND